MNIKSILSVDNLTKAGGLGVGYAAGKATQNKLFPSVFKKPEMEKFAPASSILAGMLLSSQDGLLKAVGNGMIAVGVGTVIGNLVDKEGKMGINGGDTFLGNVFMGNTDAGTDSYSDTSYDFTGSPSGEMEY